MFKDPLKIPLEEIAGFTAAEKDFRADRGTAWRRLPELRRLDSSGLGMKFNLTIFFSRPQRLPRLRRKAVQSMAGSARKARQGVYIDAVILQAEDPVGATKALSRGGIREFQSYKEALETVVGIEQDPLAASRLLEQRAATRGRDYLRLRLFSLWVLGVPAFKFYFDHGRSQGKTALLFAATLALFGTAIGTYRLARYGFSAPATGRPHHRIMFVLGPVFLIILVGLVGLSSVVPDDFETMAWRAHSCGSAALLPPSSGFGVSALTESRTDRTDRKAAPVEERVGLALLLEESLDNCRAVVFETDLRTCGPSRP